MKTPTRAHPEAAETSPEKSAIEDLRFRLVNGLEMEAKFSTMLKSMGDILVPGSNMQTQINDGLKGIGNDPLSMVKRDISKCIVELARHDGAEAVNLLKACFKTPNIQRRITVLRLLRSMKAPEAMHVLKRRASFWSFSDSEERATAKVILRSPPLGIDDTQSYIDFDPKDVVSGLVRPMRGRWLLIILGGYLAACGGWLFFFEPEVWGLGVFSGIVGVGCLIGVQLSAGGKKLWNEASAHPEIVKGLTPLQQAGQAINFRLEFKDGRSFSYQLPLSAYQQAKQYFLPDGPA
ncbi:MAG: hypothetical protein JNG86_04110 [Verrucomicrobiaceae bacterium]|nr:hypothetical protein [Verrucomicrobiaceae bacterium]